MRNVEMGGVGFQACIREQVQGQGAQHSQEGVGGGKWGDGEDSAHGCMQAIANLV